MDSVLCSFAEDESEKKQDDGGVGGKDVPDCAPFADLVELSADFLAVCEVIDNGLCAQRTDGGAEPVGHDHEQALGAAAYVGSRVLIDEQRARDIEEVECHSVNDHREYEEPYAAARIAQPEQPEAEHPGEHGYHHDTLDAEALHEKRDEQYAAGLADLRQGNQYACVFHSEGLRISRFGGETADKGIGVAVGNLQGDAEQHGEYEEDGHAALPEQVERVQAEGGCHRFLLFLRADGAGRQRQRIGSEHDAEGGRYEELVLVGHVAENVHEPHRADESDGAEYAYGREVLHGVEACARQAVECHRVAQCERRHVECHAQRVECEEDAHPDFGVGLGTIERGGPHEDAGQQVTERKQPLCGNPAVGHDAHKSGHEDGNDTLYGIEPADVLAQPYVAEVASHRREVGAPYGEL